MIGRGTDPRAMWQKLKPFPHFLVPLSPAPTQNCLYAEVLPRNNVSPGRQITRLPQIPRQDGERVYQGARTSKTHQIHAKIPSRAIANSAANSAPGLERHSSGERQNNLCYWTLWYGTLVYQ
jgi:hypothetical protein